MALCGTCGGFEYETGSCAWPHTPEAIANNRSIWEAHDATAVRRTAVADERGLPATGDMVPPADAVGHRLSPSEALAGMISKRYRKRSGLSADDPDSSDEIETGVSPAALVRARERQVPRVRHPAGCQCDPCKGV